MAERVQLSDAEIVAIVAAHGGYEDDYCVVLARELQEARAAIRDVLAVPGWEYGTRAKVEAIRMLRALLPEEEA